MNSTIKPKAEFLRETQLPADRTLTDATGYRKYEVDFARSFIFVGDTVSPETVIGFHYETKRPVKAGIQGHIGAIYYNPLHDSLMVLAVSGD